MKSDGQSLHSLYATKLTEPILLYRAINCLKARVFVYDHRVCVCTSVCYLENREADAVDEEPVMDEQSESSENNSRDQLSVCDVTECVCLCVCLF